MDDHSAAQEPLVLDDSSGTLVSMYCRRLSSSSRSSMLSAELLEQPGTGHLTNHTSNIALPAPVLCVR